MARLSGLKARWENAPKLAGWKFGRLTVLREAPRRPDSRCTWWLCRCECGVEKELRRSSLIGSKGVRSCGCLIGESRRKSAAKQKAGRGSWLPGMPYGVYSELIRWPAPPREAA